ncbi:MAG: preprotein translocase subunit SecE [Erysipelotrichaceae bacterium]|jgi:preprotein translocase SecE subunit|nr:preprotein translocase subunit SecE [Bacillota bacterium]
MLKWFSISGISKEIKRIRWPKSKDLYSDSVEVIIFTVAFMLFFTVCEFVIANLLRMAGMGV